MKQVLCHRPDFTTYGEFLWFGCVLHVDVRKWNKTVRQEVRKTLRVIASSLRVPVFAFQSPSCDPKKEKFIKDIGMSHHHRRLTASGEWADMYSIRPLD